MSYIIPPPIPPRSRASESALCSQAAGVVCGAHTCSDGAPCCCASTTLALRPPSSRGCETARCRTQRFGVTCTRCLLRTGVALSTCSALASPVSPSHTQASAPLAMTRETAGRPPHAPSGSWHRPSSSWRTSQASLLAPSPISLVSSPISARSGMMRSGQWWKLAPLAHRTTARVGGCSAGDRVMARCEVGWPNGVRWWTGSIEYVNGDLIDVRLDATGEVDCFPHEWVLLAHYPTPTKNDAKNTGSASRRRRHTVPLDGLVRGPLNPRWVEWMMGWPQQATDGAAWSSLATGRSLSQWHTQCWGLLAGQPPSSWARGW